MEARVTRNALAPGIGPACIALAVLAAAGGCGRDDPPQPAENPSTAKVATDHPAIQEQIARLQALPYASYAEVESGQQEDGVVVYDPKRSYPGYNLYVTRRRSQADLIDAQGTIVHSWRLQPSMMWAHGTLLPNGDYLVVGADESELPGEKIPDEAWYLLRLDWHGRVKWKHNLPVHHDIDVTPRGELITLTFRRRMIPEIHARLPVKDDEITLLTQAGEVLESLSIYDAVRAKPELFRLLPVRPDNLGGAPWVDLFHCNSVEWMQREHLVGRHPIYDLTNVLVCIRHQSRIIVVNWETRELVWAWGDGEILGPHDATVLKNGNILLFDNGVGRHWSRVIEFDPLTGKIVWEYKALDPTDFYTNSRGSNQRFPNGNTLITDSGSGVVFEVTREGEIVWEFRCPYRHHAKDKRATIVRCERYECDFVERIMRHVEQPEAPPP